MKLLAWCLVLAASLTLTMATHSLIGEPPRLMTPQHPNVFVYENNSLGERQDLVLPCPLMDTTNVTFKWYRVLATEDVMVPAEMVDQTTGTLTVANITDGEYASTAGVNYTCIASRIIGKSSYMASVRSRTITVFYASFGGFREMTPQEVPVSVALQSSVALECDVQLESTNPPPQIQWRRRNTGGTDEVIQEIISNNERRFLEGGRFLYIRSVEAADLEFTYQCEVINVFLDRMELAPTTYRLIDNLTLDVLVDYKQIGDLRAFVGNTSFEFSYVGGAFGNIANGTTNVLALTPPGMPAEDIPDVGNIASIDMVNTPGTFMLRATVRYDGGTTVRSGMLTVNRLPTITSNPPDRREIVVGEENLMYTCVYEGYPTPRIDWFFNGKSISPDSGVSISENTLTIASPQASNSGIYQCIVSNDVGDAQAAWLLEIREPRTPEIVSYNFTELGAFEDRELGALIVQDNATTVNFFVDVVADPCPSVTWFFDGNQLGPSNSIVSYNDPCVGAVSGDSPNWRFTLTVELTEDTSGNYSASFANIGGTKSFTQHAYFTIPAPVSVTSLTLSLACLKEGQNVSLRCNINGFPRPTVTFSFNGNPITPGVGTSIQQPFYDEITILNVNRSTEGLYGCMAEGGNPATQTNTYRFCTIPSITDFIPTPNPRIGSPFSIQCTATGIPQPDITWRKDGLLLEATEDEVLRIVEINDGRTSSVEVSEGRTEFNGIYECIATNDADSVMKIARIELLESNDFPLSLGAIIGITAGGVGLILLIALVILLLVCVYACGKKTSTGKYSANPAHLGTDYADGRGNVDKDSDEEDGQPEAFNPQYESLPALRPAQPPSYKPTPSYPMGDDMEMKKVPLPDSDSYLGGGGYMMQDNGMAYRPGVDDFLSEDAQFV